MIEIQQKKVTTIKICPFKIDFFGVHEMIEDLLKAGYQVVKDYDLIKKSIEIVVFPELNHHVDIVCEKNNIKYIGGKNLR